MKKLSFAFILSLLFTSFSLSAQFAYDDAMYDDNFYPGYLGDDFSLEGALQVFKESRNLEQFEWELNNQGRYVNNLDLNNDGRIDFIRVLDQSNDRNHRLITLQAILGRGDIQDVAVIAIEKTGRRRANLQIIGDEYLYGPDMIVEPSDIAFNQNQFERGPNANLHLSRRFFVNVWYWPTVRSVFYSRYSFYRSPYYWGFYPRIWNPWRPYRYATYYDRCGIYRTNYWRTTPTIRIVYVNNFYRPNRRVFSPRVRTRYDRCRPWYRTGRGGRVAEGGRADRDRRTGSPRGSGGRNYSQTRPERRSKFDSKREKNVVFNRDNEIKSPKNDVRRSKSVRKAEIARPDNEVRKDKRVAKYDKPTRDVRTSKAPRTSKYDRPKTEVRSDKNTYSKRPTETRKSTKRAEKRSSSFSKPKSSPSRSKRGAVSSKAPSRSSKGSYSKQRSSSKPKASSGSRSNSSRKSSVGSSSKRNSSSVRKSAPRSSSKSSSASKRSKSSSSKSRSKSSSRRGNKF